MNNQVADRKLKWTLNVPNVITAFRVVLAAIVAFLLVQKYFLPAGILLVIAAISDGLDGLLARRLKQSSLFGSLFDMIADQLLFMPNLIIAITAGIFAKAGNLMPLNPYLYACARDIFITFAKSSWSLISVIIIIDLQISHS